MNEILNCGPGIGVFFAMILTGIVLMAFSFISRKRKTKHWRS